MFRKHMIATGISFLFLLGVFGCGKTEPVATLKSPQGRVNLRETAASQFKDAHDQDPLLQDSAVRTGDDGQATLAFIDKGEMSLKPNTFFEVKQGDSLGMQNSGRIIYKIQKQGEKTINVQTPHGLTTVLGTQFQVDVTATSTTVIVNEGSVKFTGKNGATETLTPGHKASADEISVSKPAAMSLEDLEAIFSSSSKVLINPR